MSIVPMKEETKQLFAFFEGTTLSVFYMCFSFIRISISWQIINPIKQMSKLRFRKIKLTEVKSNGDLRQVFEPGSFQLQSLSP